MPSPLLFIGSSIESRSIADALQENLGNDVEAIVWDQLGFIPTHDTLTTLEGSLKTSDFAAFIFTPDDELTMRGETTRTVRDNVIFECGLFIGSLGRGRTFIVQPAGSTQSQHLPTDLFGLTTLTYNPANTRGTDDERKRALLKAANQIRAAVRRLKERPTRPVHRRVDGVLPRGSTISIAAMADGAIHVADKRHEYFQTLRRYLRNEEIVPSKYLYWTPQGSSDWLELCKRGNYPYYDNSIKLLGRSAEAIVAKTTQTIGTAAVDLVSVGSGDGAKDHILLKQLKNALKPDEYIYYYPVDISDTLIVEAVRTALGKGLSHKPFRVKAIVADFVELRQLQAFYEERPAKNLFSVLGNTIGNADEDQVIGAVSNAMLDGDLVLIEVNTGAASGPDPIWTDPVAARHDFTPLGILNVTFEPEKLRYETLDGKSMVPDTRSVLTSYTDALIGEYPMENIKLAILHYYDFEAFKHKVEHKMNVTTLWSDCDNDVGLMLAIREPDDDGQ